MKSTIELTTTENPIEYTFDWYNLPDEAKFVAVDSDGVVCWYGSKPELGTNSWIFGCESYNFIEDFGVRVYNWKDTLTPRPQVAKFKVGDLVRIKHNKITCVVASVCQSVDSNGTNYYGLINGGNQLYKESDLVRTNTKVKKATFETVEYDESEIEIGLLWTPKSSTLFDGHVYMLVRTTNEFVTVSLTMPGEIWSWSGDAKKDVLNQLVPFHGEVTLKSQD